MAQTIAWEDEYKNSKLVTKKPEPQKDFLRFLRYLKKEGGIELEGLKILDLGSGTGRNANYLASLGNKVTGFELSRYALDLALARAKKMKVQVDYRCFNMGQPYPFEDDFFDLIIDVTSSNSLNEKERKIYLQEVHRVLKKDGHFFVKALCKDGDKNAKALIKNNPGIECDTYVNTNMNLIERVFSQEDFVQTYGQFFKVLKLNKKTSYTRFKNQNYKRNFFLAYMKKGLL